MIAGRTFTPHEEGMRPEEIRMYRIVLLLGAPLNLIFWGVHRILLVNGADPLWQRGLLSAYCLALACASYGPPWVRARMRWGIELLAYGGTIWWIRRVAASGLNPEFAVGLSIVPSIVGLAFHRASRHLTYAVVTVAVAAVSFLAVPAPAVQPIFVVLSLATLLGLMHLLNRTRLRAYDELLASEDLRQVLIDQTTDALVLVDPILREAVECNGRARSMFDVPPGGSIRSLGAAAFGAEELRVTDIVMVMKEIGNHGTFARERHYVTPGGREFDGDLAISAVRLGRRRVWLMRVADESDRHRQGPKAGEA